MRKEVVMLYERIAPALDVNWGEALLLMLFVLLVLLTWAYDSARYYYRIRIIRVGKYRYARKQR